MATKKPVATISYNTAPFIKKTIENLIKSDIVSYGEFVYHLGEMDEGELNRDKDHFHLFLHLNRAFSLNSLQRAFIEIDKEHPDSKPLGCMPFQPSVEEDWLLYSLHYPPYLRLHHKGGDYHEKEFEYSLGDVIVVGIDNEEEYLRRVYTKGLSEMKECGSGIITDLGRGVSAADLIRSGSSPILVNQCNKALHDSDDFNRLLAENKELKETMDNRMSEINLLKKFIKQYYNGDVRFSNGKLRYVGDFQKWNDFIPKEEKKELSKVPSIEKPVKISAPVVSSSESVSAPVESEVDDENLLNEMVENV